MQAGDKNEVYDRITVLHAAERALRGGVRCSISKKAREKGLDERTIAILEKMNVNSIREKSCDGHVFERPETDRLGRYICKKCGCSEDTTWISGYNRGIEHTKADAEKYKLALFAVIRNSKVLPKGLILGKSATEINKMSRETMDEVLKSLDFEKIRSWYDGKEVK